MPNDVNIQQTTLNIAGPRMKTVFEAANSLEAHMILGLLRQSGIEGEILGEALQGGIGDLPVAGIVRVVVSDTDFSAARAIVENWNATHVDALPAAAAHGNRPPALTRYVIPFMIGVIVGVLSARSYFLSNKTTNGIDHDGDGRLDELWHYSGNLIQRVDNDFNRDGSIDAVTNYDISGNLRTSSHDINFDGKFESQSTYKKGLVTSTDHDLDKDGKIDVIDKFQHGYLTQREFFVRASTLARKRQHFRNGLLIEAELDSDGDGIFDTLIHYNEIEEITRSEPLSRASR